VNNAYVCAGPPQSSRDTYPAWVPIEEVCLRLLRVKKIGIIEDPSITRNGAVVTRHAVEVAAHTLGIFVIKAWRSDVHVNVPLADGTPEVDLRRHLRARLKVDDVARVPAVRNANAGETAVFARLVAAVTAVLRCEAIRAQADDDDIVALASGHGAVHGGAVEGVHVRLHLEVAHRALVEDSAAGGVHVVGEAVKRVVVRVTRAAA